MYRHSYTFLRIHLKGQLASRGLPRFKVRAWDVFAKCREADLREGASVPRPPDGARPAVARAERLLRTRRRLARAVSLLTHRSRAGLLKASSTPRRSLCFHLSFSHSRARNCSLRFDLRIAKRAGGGGARTVLSKRLSRFQTFPSPPKVPSPPSLPLWTRPVHILRFNRLSVADEAGVSSAPSPHFCHDSSF